MSISRETILYRQHKELNMAPDAKRQRRAVLVEGISLYLAAAVVNGFPLNHFSDPSKNGAERFSPCFPEYIALMCSAVLC